MPRKHYSEVLIQDCLELWQSLESTGHHRRYGVKDHMGRLLSSNTYRVSRRDVNAILDALHARGLVGEHHVVAQVLESKYAGTRGYFGALAQNRLLNNIRSFKGQKTITPGVHKLLAIPDAHATVGLTNERFAWAARLAADRKPEYIVQIGDWCSWDCFSGHEKAGSLKYAKKPSWEIEFACFNDSVQQFEKQLPKRYNPRKFITLGNHEERIYNYEDANPVTDRAFSGRMEQVFESDGWQWSPYGARQYVEGVCFTHIPLNVMGKRKSPAAIKRDLSCDLYSGDSHKKIEEKVPKDDENYTMIAGGCFMPEGYLPPYATYTQTGWWYGVQILTIEDGRIRDTEWISCKALEEKYG